MKPDHKFIKAKIRIRLKQSSWICYFSIVINILFCCLLSHTCSYLRSWKKSTWSVKENPIKDLVFYLLCYIFNYSSFQKPEDKIQLISCYLFSTLFPLQNKGQNVCNRHFKIASVCSGNGQLSVQKCRSKSIKKYIKKKSEFKVRLWFWWKEKLILV